MPKSVVVERCAESHAPLSCQRLSSGTPGSAQGGQRAILDDFRRDFVATPVAWSIRHAEDTTTATLAEGLRRAAAASGHLPLDALSPDAGEIPRLWLPAAHVCLTPQATRAAPAPTTIPRHALRVLVSSSRGASAGGAPGWDRFLSATDPAALFAAIASEARLHHLKAIITEAEAAPPPACKLSVVICTYRRPGNLARALASLAAQQFPVADHELLIVNNDPADRAPAEIVAEARRTSFAPRPDRLRLVQCPFPGLSFARNAGISQARGEVVSFLDDDAVAPPDWLEQVWRTFDAHPEAGVIGGAIILDMPEPRPRWLKPGWEKFWSHRVPPFTTPTAVDRWWDFPWGANWSARRRVLVAMGGFRTRYGRRGANAAGGEEIVAACLARALGHTVVVAPAVRVVHAPDPDRFTLRHVWGRMLAARREEYRWQRDGYLPREMRLAGVARASARHLKRAWRRGLAAPERLEHLMGACADASLLVPLLRERWSWRP